MRVALVHEFLNQRGGAERCLEIFHELFPTAPVYTFIHDESKVPFTRGWDVRPSIVDKLPLAKRNHYYYLWLYPALAGRFDLDEYDLVFSNSHAFGKSVRTKGIHICYCHTPMRFAHVMPDEYVGDFSPVKRWVVRNILERIKAWDIATADRVNHFIANSTEVQRRIANLYRRDSTLIHPPVDGNYYVPGASTDGYYLIVTRLVAFKRVDIAVRAFNEMRKPLTIVGTGRELERLQRLAGPTIEFAGAVSDERLRLYYQNCKALVFPQNEDFGIVSLEAQACGKPVIAFRRGGALDTVIDGQTGVFFDEQTPKALSDAVRMFETIQFDPGRCRTNALRFDRAIFKESINKFITECLDHHAGPQRSS
jgi:glycosyltransferase involved in cell wall biosynthesis